MTESLYLASIEAGYASRFRARVVSSPPGAVVLDRSAFYPVGGGQPADHGTLVRPDGTAFPVVHVTRSGSEVVHRLGPVRPAPPPPAAGEELEGRIDWTRRYAHMRAHTAQHLLSARVFARTGRRTHAATVGAAEGRLTLEPGPSLDGPALEADLAEWIARAVPLEIRFCPRREYDRAPAPRSGLVPLAAHIDPVRLVQIGPSEASPCGGTHLRSTAEIGAYRFGPPRETPDGELELLFTLDGRPTPPG